MPSMNNSPFFLFICEQREAEDDREGDKESIFTSVEIFIMQREFITLKFSLYRENFTLKLSLQLSRDSSMDGMIKGGVLRVGQNGMNL
jgi:hypothetical protein